MVHALNEVKRVLAPSGILLDIRPEMDQWPVEIASAGNTEQTGRTQDFEGPLKDDETANRIMRNANSDNLLILETHENFPIFYSWDTPSEMEQWIDDEWEGFIKLDKDTRRATRSVWAVANADSRVQIKMKMLIAKWRKST